MAHKTHDQSKGDRIAFRLAIGFVIAVLVVIPVLLLLYFSYED